MERQQLWQKKLQKKFVKKMRVIIIHGDKRVFYG